MDELVVGPGPPGASYTVTVRVSARPHPALLPRLGQAVSSAGAVVVGMDLVEVAAAGTTVDLTLQAASEEHVAAVTAALERSDYHVRHVSDRTFLYHLGGKIEVTPRVAIRTRQDLLPGVHPRGRAGRERHRPPAVRRVGAYRQGLLGGDSDRWQCGARSRAARAVGSSASDGR